MTIEIDQYHMEYAEKHCAAVRASIEGLKEWFTWVVPNYCLCDSIKFIEDQSKQKNQNKYEYAIIDNDDGEFLGSCSLTKVKTYNGEQIASMSYWRNQKSKKEHIGTIAANKLKNKAFDELGINRIEIDIAHCNKRSIGVAKNIGAKPERDILIRGGDGKMHVGIRYVIEQAVKE
jgi:ribosomal-protein-serine acetyltransferase